MPDHSMYAKKIHEANVKAGWWTNLLTGESILETRNVPEMIALMHSELDEAWEGAITRKNDDHLENFLMFDVELADTCIRIYDLLGAKKIDPATITVVRQKLDDNMAINLCWCHYHLTQALEGFRKNRRPQAATGLVTALYTIWDFAELCGINLEVVMLAKLQYNQTRADHKPENRKLDDGKKF